MKYSDLVREHVEQRAVKPARNAGKMEFSVVAGEVHKALGFSNQVPLVCQALRSRKLLQANNIVIKSESGPPSGQSTTMVFTYRFADTPGTPAQKQTEPSPLRALAGKGKALWGTWGGGESFLRQERLALEDRREKDKDKE